MWYPIPSYLLKARFYQTITWKLPCCGMFWKMYWVHWKTLDNRAVECLKCKKVFIQRLDKVKVS